MNNAKQIGQFSAYTYIITVKMQYSLE